METSYALSYETGLFIQSTPIDAAVYLGESTIAMPMVVSLIAVIERNTNKK